MGAPDREAMMQAWTRASMLGEYHAALGHFVGDWKIEAKYWMDGPDKPPTVSVGTSEVRWLIEGRWLIERLSSEMMGNPFCGASITGYDNLKKKVVSIWLDSMSTALMRTEGNYLDRKTLLSFGFYDDPVSGEHDRLQRFVSRIEGDDRHTMTIHDLSAGVDGVIMMEVVSTRVKTP